MPTYTFRDTTTNIDEDIFMKYSEIESYLENNPSKIKIVTSPSIISGVESG